VPHYLAAGVTLLDMTQAGTTVALMDQSTAAVSTLASRVRGYMDAGSLAEVSRASGNAGRLVAVPG
jgi:hypothetical protein